MVQGIFFDGSFGPSEVSTKVLTISRFGSLEAVLEHSRPMAFAKTRFRRHGLDMKGSHTISDYRIAECDVI